MYNVNELINSEKVHFNLSVKELIKIAVEKEGGKVASNGALCINTGTYTGRSPNDRFIVDEPSVHNHINWGKTNVPISTENFEKLYDKAMDYMKNKEELYVFHGFVGADEAYKMPIRVINEFANQNLFAQQMFIKPKDGELEGFNPEFTVIAMPDLKAIPEVDGTNSEVFIIISFEKKVVLIGGTKYSGEIKKSMFTVMNYLLPFKNILPMHCSANVGENGDVTLFFGLSGTGKTTLSADHNRKLIGDDEHGWTENGVFNFEGGCYAKTINLSPVHEPQIWNAIKEGAVLENVVLDENGVPDYTDEKYTENTRAAFPVDHIEGAIMEGNGGIPNTIIFLTADATGVLPPISKLTKEQAMYHFMSGYTSKLAGTERGIIEPTATFSTCFGGPFMILRPQVYAKLLGEKIDQYNANVFLVNTGWTGGSYGTGKRMKLKYTRAMVRAAMNGELNQASYVKDPIFKLQIPTACTDVPSEILNPSNTWEDVSDYNKKATELALSFNKNFQQFNGVSEEIEKVNTEIILNESIA